MSDTKPFGLEAALRAIEIGEYTAGDVAMVARRCRERGSKLALWCDHCKRLERKIISLSAEVERLRQVSGEVGR